VRLVTDQNADVIARHDYLPFGEEIGAGIAARNGLWGPQRDTIDQKFTGKERDQETGLDYFGARYYGSSLGRWTSPDLVNVTEDRMVSPSSTLNKYVYGGNNPLKFTDPDGEDITVFYTNGGMAGHTMMLAYDQSTGDSAVQSFGPVSHSASSEAEMGLGIAVSGTGNYGFADIKSADQLRQDYASITIQTSPEETQKVIQYIRTHSDGDYATYSNNCTTTCGKILRSLSLYKKNSITPKGFFTDLLQQYGSSKNPATIQYGQDYGKPRSGYDAFQLMFLGIQNQESASKKPKEVVKSKVCYSGDDGKQNCESSN
jgi:RHS repeat-associated protein